MSSPSSRSTLTIEIDLNLATAYRDAYKQTFSSRVKTKQTLDKFIAGFVEDRLAEEITFLEQELANDHQ